MDTFLHDGTEFDLGRTYVDVVGGEWTWTGQRNGAGEPLMRSDDVVLSLPDVYHDHGPLIAMAIATTGAAVRSAFSAAFAASSSAGFVESPDAWAARLAWGGA
jgi:hypothetical protein